MKRADLVWITFLLVITISLVIPASQTVFVSATQNHPYWMGFIKFALFATMGEMLANRIVSGNWKRLNGMWLRMIVWGVIGMMIVFMFPLYQSGVTGMVDKGLLVSSDGLHGRIFQAFMISAIMNLTFAPVFMAAHRISDTYIDQKFTGGNPTLTGAIQSVDWPGYYSFIVGKTIPFFWIPAHTITFLLPSEFRVIYAAYLSIALGAILAYGRRRVAKA